MHLNIDIYQDESDIENIIIGLKYAKTRLKNKSDALIMDEAIDVFEQILEES